MPTPLSDSQIHDALAELRGWSCDNDRLHKSFGFSDFREAMSFIVRVGFAAEAADHHPTLTNVYNKVTLGLNTHDAGGKVTQKDVELAAAIEKFNWLPEK
jgi:4a-hydroxytetrahydrobiopterin dehydratase